MFDIFDENGYTGEGTEETGNVEGSESVAGSSPEITRVPGSFLAGVR